MATATAPQGARSDADRPCHPDRRRAHALTAVAAVAVAAVAATLRLWLATPPASLGARRTCMVG